MKLLKILAWTGLVVIIAWDIAQYIRVHEVAPEFTILQLELAGHDEGVQLLADNAEIRVVYKSVLQEARLNTLIDFLFIICYVSCFFMVCYHEMQQQRTKLFNAVLRLNLFLCFLAGIADVAENYALLYDFRHFHYDGAFISTRWIALTKWILVGWMILTLVIARVYRLFEKHP